MSKYYVKYKGGIFCGWTVYKKRMLWPDKEIKCFYESAYGPLSSRMFAFDLKKELEEYDES